MKTTVKKSKTAHTKRLRPAALFAAACILLLLGAGVVSAAEPGKSRHITNNPRPEELSIIDAYIEKAMENNPELHSLEGDYQASRSMIPQAGALPDPEVNIAYYINPEDPETFLGRFSVSAMQMFPWYNTRQTRQDEQSALADGQLYALEDRQAKIAADIQRIWFDYTALILSVEIIREHQELVSDLESIVSVRYETARAGTADLLRIQMEDQRLQTRILHFEDRKNTYKARFNELVNRDASAEIKVPDHLFERKPAFPKEEIAFRIREDNPGLDALDAREKAAAHRTELARLEGRPDIGVGLEVMGRDFTSMSMMPDPKEGYVGMVSIRIPLYRSRYDAKIRQSLEEKRSAMHQKKELANRLLRQMEEAFVDWRESERNRKLLDEELIPRARQAIDVLQEEYGAGNVRFDELLQVQRELLDLEIERINALAMQNKAVVQIEYLYSATPGR
ncbi:MAG: TolC family protein [Desulfosalsimonadaceae bacterium]